jgi:CheY-like chemotaxis protein
MAHILVVDDDPDFQDQIAMVLEAAGHEVERAYDGRQALGLMRERRPALVLLDVMMTTDTEGFGVVQEIRRNEAFRDLPIIMLSAIHEEKRLSYRFEPDSDWLPVDCFLDKPVKPAVLLEAVAGSLAGGRSRRQSD